MSGIFTTLLFSVCFEQQLSKLETADCDLPSDLAMLTGNNDTVATNINSCLIISTCFTNVNLYFFFKLPHTPVDL